MKFSNIFKKIKALKDKTGDPLRKHELINLECVASLQKQMGEKKVSSSLEKRVKKLEKNPYSAGEHEKHRGHYKKWWEK